MFWKTSIVFIAIIAEIVCSGVFEIRLKSFSNDNGKDMLGICCSGERNGHCSAPCRTSFRVCLKHYQAQIDLDSPCTFGDIQTPILGGNNINMDDTDLKGFTNPLRFPFDFTWPGTFSLIIEAWHDISNSSEEDRQTTRGKTLITRLTTQKWLDVSASWQAGEHRTTQATMFYEYRVTCDTQYFGPGCTTLCRTRDDPFGHYVCTSTGDKRCLPGWTGDYCTKPKCLSGCDETHGHCGRPDECLCHSGWKGPLCDQCERYPGCLHGTCNKPWECNCDEGWGGLFCNQDLNYCTNHKPCKNSGTCFNTGQGSYTCSCPPGYNGTDCQEVLIMEEPDVPLITTKAPCDVGDNGLCKKPDPCIAKPCKNGGTCTPNMDNTEYSCSCLKGFTGDKCDKNINDCPDINPCLNGGFCIDMVNEFKCQCIPGYVGPDCSIKVAYCVAKPCANGGICEDRLNDFICRCKSGFAGKDCSTNIDECASNPCANAGVCKDYVNGFQCECAPGWRGPTCQENMVTMGNQTRESAAVVEKENETESSGFGFDTEHVVFISSISVAVPLIVLVAVIIVFMTKLRRRQEQQRADDEARAQNEQNSVHSHVVKLGDTHMIKNTWDKQQKNSAKKVETNTDLSYSKSYYI